MSSQEKLEYASRSITGCAVFTSSTMGSPLCRDSGFGPSGNGTRRPLADATAVSRSPLAPTVRRFSTSVFCRLAPRARSSARTRSRTVLGGCGTPLGVVSRPGVIMFKKACPIEHSLASVSARLPRILFACNRSSAPLSILFEQIHPVLVRDDDGGSSSSTERSHRELRSDSRRAVDDVLRPTATTPVLIPDQERRPTGIDRKS